MTESHTSTKRWQSEASRVLKARLARHGMSYGDLVARLNAHGATESYASVANKVGRGTFSFAFYLQCISVLEPTLSEVDAAPLISSGQRGR